MSKTDHVMEDKVQEERFEQDDLDARINVFTPEEQKKLKRRIDRRLVFTLGTLYCVSLLDRNNLGVANIAGMGVDLELDGPRYSTIALVFWVTYTLFQPAAVVIMRKIGPRIFLATICLLWGLVMICFGFVKEWSTLVGLRVVLGVFEAGLVPGCVYLLSCWYVRYEVQTRYAGFIVIGIFVSAFSGILGYGISQLKNHGFGPSWWGQHYGPTKANPSIEPGVYPGIAGWRWIFIFYGTFTAAIGLVAYVLLVDFPENATRTFLLPFLKANETDFVVARLEKDRRDVALEPFHLGSYLRHGLDLKIWGFASIFGLTTVTIVSSVTFLPIILNTGMGFGIAASQCLTAPPFIFSCVVMLVQGWLGDKYHLRGPILVFNCCAMFVGLALLGYVSSPGVRYFGSFITAAMSQANIPCVLAWQANNVRGQWKRAFSSATVVGTGGVGGVIGSLVFRLQDAPLYRPGIWACMAANGLILLIVPLLTLKFYRANQRAQQGGKAINGVEGFLYTY